MNLSKFHEIEDVPTIGMKRYHGHTHPYTYRIWNTYNINLIGTFLLWPFVHHKRRIKLSQKKSKIKRNEMLQKKRLKWRRRRTNKQINNRKSKKKGHSRRQMFHNAQSKLYTLNEFCVGFPFVFAHRARRMV